jgi:hypothetical protein
VLTELMRRYCTQLKQEMDGANITPDEHDAAVYEKFIEDLYKYQNRHQSVQIANGMK